MTASDSLSMRANTPAVMPETKMLANDTHPLGMAMHVAGVSASGLGSTVVLGTNNGETVVTYTPPLNYIGSDTFTYTNADSCGVTAVGTVNVTVTASGSFFNLVSATTSTAGADTVLTIVAQGIPGLSYHLQRAATLEAGAVWTEVLTLPAGTSGADFGRVVFSLTNPPTPAFYRTMTP